MTPAETAAQLHLAADILETGHPFEWRNEDFSEWHPANGNSVHHFMDNCVIRPILARPPYKAKLHNPNGLTAEQVGVGYRLAIVNEALLQDFYEFWGKGSKSWSKGCFNTKAKGICTYRLPLSVPWPEQSKPFTLPIQTLAQDQVELTSEMQKAANQVLKKEMQGLDPYADLKKAHAEGKVIQIKLKLSGAWTTFNGDFDNLDSRHELRIKPNDSPPWIGWHGGECPVPRGTMIDVRYRDGEEKYNLCALEVTEESRDASISFWPHDGLPGDIIAYRVLKGDAEKPDPYAELKKAHAEGKVIQVKGDERWHDFTDPKWDSPVEFYRIKPDDSPPWIQWHGGECPLKDEEVEKWEFRYRGEDKMIIPCAPHPSTYRWSHENKLGDIIAYRVIKWREKRPKMQLEACDVPPGSVIRANAAKVDGDVEWWSVKRVEKRGVILSKDLWTWEELANSSYGWQINRSIPLTGKWNPNAWEACEK